MMKCARESRVPLVVSTGTKPFSRAIVMNCGSDMIKKISVAVILVLMTISLQAKPKPATSEQISRVEPPCWWTGMKTSLQIMVQGPQISTFDVEIKGKGLSVSILTLISVLWATIWR